MVEIKKMVHELYDRSVILELVVETVMPTLYILNIQAIPEYRIKETKEEKREKKIKGKEK